MEFPLMTKHLKAEAIILYGWVSTFQLPNAFIKIEQIWVKPTRRFP